MAAYIRQWEDGKLVWIIKHSDIHNISSPGRAPEPWSRIVVIAGRCSYVHKSRITASSIVIYSFSDSGRNALCRHKHNKVFLFCV